MTSQFVKLTLEPKGIWRRIKNLFAIDPHRSSGIPINAKYRNPAPGSITKPYHEAPQLPSSDIAGNQYYQRDVRRAYALPSAFDQARITSLLAAPAAAEGVGGGETALVATKDLSEVLASTDAGLPPTPNSGVKWAIEEDKSENFGDEVTYPVRMFK